MPWRKDRLPTPVLVDFPCGSAGKGSACNEEDLGSIPGLGSSSGEGKGYPLYYSGHYSGLEKSMDYTCSPWCCKESDTTERLSRSFSTVRNPFRTLKSFNVKCKRCAPQGALGVVCGEPPPGLPTPRTPNPYPHGSHSQSLCSAGEPPPTPPQPYPHQQGF